jgi:hypothetical protein
MRIVVLSSVVLTLALAVAACGGADSTSSSGSSKTTATKRAQASSADVAAVRASLTGIQAEVTAWHGAKTAAEAHTHAEAAVNLIEGPKGPDYGDIDKDGTLSGENTMGLLPGDGIDGIASPLAGGCADAPILGGSWKADEVAQRWADVHGRVANFTQGNDRFRDLDSRPQRIVGYALLGLKFPGLASSQSFSDRAPAPAAEAIQLLDC